ncbi:unnamed protein product [Adineta steineri]|uniref:Uncharacterized protein n=1 Tax=Adineta steineri TaxID=433720 RepID=A0A818W4Q3_9BILA|nr:unnamed protein product [Adineta steineri]CAF1111819.1 unnamed protein product [Adineta steineri]CAF3720588.1 unnamed protein product [Adineta steineri]
MSDEDSPPSSNEELVNEKPSSSTGKHIYFDEEHDDNEDLPTQKIIERPITSTIRVDGSDLITRCKDFIPLLSDTNENSIHKDKLNENNDDDELNLPDLNDDSSSGKSEKESGEASSTTDEEIVKKKRKKKKKKKKKKVKTDENLNQDVNVNNQDVISQ